MATAPLRKCMSSVAGTPVIDSPRTTVATSLPFWVTRTRTALRSFFSIALSTAASTSSADPSAVVASLEEVVVAWEAVVDPDPEHAVVAAKHTMSVAPTNTALGKRLPPPKLSLPSIRVLSSCAIKQPSHEQGSLSVRQRSVCRRAQLQEASTYPRGLPPSLFTRLPRRDILGNPHSPGPIAPGPARPASRQLSHNALQTLLAPVPCWGHWTGQQPLRLLKHTKQFPQIRVQRLPALPLYTDLRGPIRVG